MITDRTIEEVKDSAKIEEVVGDFLNLKKRGSNYIGLCPFHDEKTPSFNVNPSRNIFKCFGCGKGGDPISFIREHEHYSYTEAIRYLAEKYGIKIEYRERSQEQKDAEQLAESFHLINQFAADYFSGQLWDTEAGRAIGMSYFKERGYGEQIIKAFSLGFAPDERQGLKEAIATAGYDFEKAGILGLVKDGQYDFFRNRVIFPIHNLSGKVIAFAGRTLGTSQRGPKYINSPESPVYKKSRILYGLCQAKNAIRKHDECLLVEGYTDVLSLVQAGIDHVVASSGTALTREQVLAVKRFTSRITILYDGDAAGIKAAFRGLDIILAEDMDVRVVVLPENEDPDSFIRASGQQRFLEYVTDNARDFILLKTDLLQQETGNDPLKKSAAIKEMITSLALVPDAVKRALYIKECAVRLDLDERMLIRETSTAIRHNLTQKRLSAGRAERRADSREEKSASELLQRTKEPQFIPEQAGDQYQERDIIRILIQDGARIFDQESGQTVARFILENISDIISEFQSPLHRRILDWVQERDMEGRPLRDSDFVTADDPDIKALSVDLLTTDYQYSENWLNKKDLPLLSQVPPEENYQRDCVQSIMRLKLRKIMRKIAENQKHIEKYSTEENLAMVDEHIKIHYELISIRDQITIEFQNVVLRV